MPSSSRGDTHSRTITRHAMATRSQDVYRLGLSVRAARKYKWKKNNGCRVDMRGRRVMHRLAAYAIWEAPAWCAVKRKSQRLFLGRSDYADYGFGGGTSKSAEGPGPLNVLRNATKWACSSSVRFN